MVGGLLNVGNCLIFVCLLSLLLRRFVERELREGVSRYLSTIAHRRVLFTPELLNAILPLCFMSVLAHPFQASKQASYLSYLDLKDFSNP